MVILSQFISLYILKTVTGVWLNLFYENSIQLVNKMTFYNYLLVDHKTCKMITFKSHFTGMARTNDDQETWGQYGGFYGGNTYYKDRNDYHKSLNHWRLNDIDRTFGVKPYKNQGFNYHNLGKDSWAPGGQNRYGDFRHWKRGRWSDSGISSGLDYGESNHYKKTDIHYYGREGGDDDVVVKGKALLKKILENSLEFNLMNLSTMNISVK